MEFSYEIEKKQDHTTIKIKGNLIEKGQAEALLKDIEELIANESYRFVVNMEEFKYMNSTGLGILLNILTKARKAGGEAVICAVPDKIKDLLVVTKLNNVFSVVEDESLAVQTLN
ncbi:MAG: STAS domain-containing protein [Bacteroidia bacterium]|nr:STAS domain-containing protein [Bacteroidia bacterium]